MYYELLRSRTAVSNPHTRKVSNDLLRSFVHSGQFWKGEEQKLANGRPSASPNVRSCANYDLKKTEASHINVLMTKRIARSGLDGHIICQYHEERLLRDRYRRSNKCVFRPITHASWVSSVNTVTCSSRLFLERWYTSARFQLNPMQLAGLYATNVTCLVNTFE